MFSRGIARTLVVAWAMASCTVEPLDPEGKLCDETRSCPQGFLCVMATGATGGSCSLVGCGSPAPACALTQGVCEGTTRRCVGTGYEAVCSSEDYGPAYEDFEVTCEGWLDNDCNGEIDVSREKLVASQVLRHELGQLDGGLVLATQEILDGGEVIALRRLSERLDVEAGPFVLSAGHRIVSGPALSRTLNRLGVTWAEASAVDGGPEVWLAQLDPDTLSVLEGTLPDGGRLSLRGPVAQAEVANGPRVAMLDDSYKQGFALVWVEPSGKVALAFEAFDGGTSLAYLPATGPLGAVAEVDIVDWPKWGGANSGYAVAFTASDAGQSFVGLRSLTAGNLLFGVHDFPVDSPPSSPRLVHTDLKNYNECWVVWNEGSPGAMEVRARSTYPAAVNSVRQGAGARLDATMLWREPDRMIVTGTGEGGTWVAAGDADATKPYVSTIQPAGDAADDVVVAVNGAGYVVMVRRGTKLWGTQRCRP